MEKELITQNQLLGEFKTVAETLVPVVENIKNVKLFDGEANEVNNEAIKELKKVLEFEEAITKRYEEFMAQFKELQDARTKILEQTDQVRAHFKAEALRYDAIEVKKSYDVAGVIVEKTQKLDDIKGIVVSTRKVEEFGDEDKFQDTITIRQGDKETIVPIKKKTLDKTKLKKLVKDIPEVKEMLVSKGLYKEDSNTTVSFYADRLVVKDGE